MSSGIDILSNRLSPGTAQDSTHRQQISFHDFGRGALCITLALPATVVALLLVRAAWPSIGIAEVLKSGNSLIR